MNVYQKLNAARLKLQGMELKKSGRNEFAKYNYFELGDFLPTVQVIFAELGLCGVVDFGVEEASLRIINIEKPEEIIAIGSPMSTAALKGCHEVQNLGAVQTYIRRYLWVAAMEIVEHDALEPTTKTDQIDPKEQRLKVLETAAKSGLEALSKACKGLTDAQINELDQDRLAEIKALAKRKAA